MFHIISQGLQNKTLDASENSIKEKKNFIQSIFSNKNLTRNVIFGLIRESSRYTSLYAFSGILQELSKRSSSPSTAKFCRSKVAALTFSSSVLSSAFTYPLSTISNLFFSSKNSTNPLNILQNSSAEQIIRKFYRGFIPHAAINATKDTLLNVSTFQFIDHHNKHLERISIKKSFSFGCALSLFAETLFYPFSTAHKLMVQQENATYKSAFDSLLKSSSKSKIPLQPFYKGFLSHLIYSVPSFGISTMFLCQLNESQQQMIYYFSHPMAIQNIVQNVQNQKNQTKSKNGIRFSPANKLQQIENNLANKNYKPGKRWW